MDSIEVPAFDKPDLEMESIDKIIFITEMVSVDEIEIKGDSMSVRLDNEYVEETEVVETTTTNLRSGTTQKTTVNEQ